MEKGYIPTPYGPPLFPIEDPLTNNDPLTDEKEMEIRQLSKYNSNNKAAPDNNLFFEERSNPLSSKGD